MTRGKMAVLHLKAIISGLTFLIQEIEDWESDNEDFM